MRQSKQEDNSTFEQKVMLRQTALRLVDGAPVVLETHGGRGDLWSAVYSDITTGAVFEKDPFRANRLAMQRPAWAVYEADCEAALALGAGAHLAANLLDVDPYGDPWPTLHAFFNSRRPRPPKLVVVVNDGLRRAALAGTAWNAKSLEEAVQVFGNGLAAKYLEVCRWLMEKAARPAGYRVTFFDGYYCGDKGAMTHYLATLVL